MTNLITKLYNDEAGFIVSSELILVATICVIGLIVGLAEVSHNVNQELEDVGTAVTRMNQSYTYSGFSGAKGKVPGSEFRDTTDVCDSECDISCDNGPQREYDE